MAVLIACDDNELSLVRVKNLKGFTAKPIPISTEKDLSDKAVVVIGTPQGIENMIFDGRISKAGRIKTEDGTFMYVNASINPGNSGGMLATLGDMKLVGVMSQVEINSNPPSLTDIGLFVPNDIINKFLDKAMPK
jgi:S1-C subfamily serine protease